MMLDKINVTKRKRLTLSKLKNSPECSEFRRDGVTQFSDRGSRCFLTTTKLLKLTNGLKYNDMA